MSGSDVVPNKAAQPTAKPLARFGVG